MFTGIIEAVGQIVSVQPRNGDLRLRVDTKDLVLSDVQIGDSIATNGVCLTATELPGNGYWADVSVETMAFTTVSQWQMGQAVNLEKALTPETRMGGHIVSGHVDGVGEVVSRRVDARSERIRIRAPKDMAKYIAHKGSITIDGTSLTVNAVDGAEFEINIVPHTIAKTVIGTYQPGTKVNLEVDVIARYLERLLLGDKVLGDKAADTNQVTSIDLDFLAKNGFYK